MAVAPRTEHSAGQGRPAGSVAPIDWSALLGESGLPPNVVNELNRIFTRTPDINQAITIGQAYVRSTPWYAQTFPAIQAGITSGLFTDEAGYRQYQAQLGQLYHQYNNRAPTQQELVQHIMNGENPTLVGNKFQGQAFISANLPQIQQTAGAMGDTGALTQPELTALGNEKAGIDTPLGQLVQARLARAQERLKGAFNGVLASPALSVAGGRLAGVQAQKTPDVGA